MHARIGIGISAEPAVVLRGSVGVARLTVAGAPVVAAADIVNIADKYLFIVGDGVAHGVSIGAVVDEQRAPGE